MGIQNRGHQLVSRGKLPHISRRASAMSSAVISTLYSSSNPSKPFSGFARTQGQNSENSGELRDRRNVFSSCLKSLVLLRVEIFRIGGNFPSVPRFPEAERVKTAHEGGIISDCFRRRSLFPLVSLSN